MINNYDIAVLSEKVAYLEAAIKNAGIELPEVTTDDNGKTLQVVAGAWATGDKIPAVPSVINSLDSTSETDALSAAQGKTLDGKITGLLKVHTATLDTTAQGVTTFSTDLLNKKVLAIYSPGNQYVCIPFCTPAAGGFIWCAKVFGFYSFTPVEATGVDFTVIYTD